VRPSDREAVRLNRDSSSIISMEAQTASWGRSNPAMTASPIVLIMVPDRPRMILFKISKC
jgi:hypothetical protein